MQRMLQPRPIGKHEQQDTVWRFEGRFSVESTSDLEDVPRHERLDLVAGDQQPRCPQLYPRACCQLRAYQRHGLSYRLKPPAVHGSLPRPLALNSGRISPRTPHLRWRPTQAAAHRGGLEVGCWGLGLEAYMRVCQV